MHTSSWLESLIQQTLKPFGISPQQYNVLRILRGQRPHPATLQLIQERMIDRMSNASRLVEKLRQKGLVQRTVCEENRRKVDIVILEKGLKLLRDVQPDLERMNISFMDKISVDEARQLNATLDKLRG